MHRTPLYAIPLVAAVVACQAGPRTLSDAQRAAVADTVEGLTDSLFAAAGRADFDALAAYFHNTTDLTWAYQAQTWESWATVDSVFRPSFAELSHQNIDVAKTVTTVLAPDIAYVLLEGSYTATDTAGVTSSPIRYAWGGVWVRRNGEWKVLAGFESDQPADSQ